MPSFTYSSIAPGVFQFTDTSNPVPASWAWDLDGDGLTDSTEQNPVWAYSSPCTSANVRLSVSSTGADSTLFLFGAANQAAWNFGIPSDPGIVGLLMYNQALVLDPGFHALGVVFSDAVAVFGFRSVPR